MLLFVCRNIVYYRVEYYSAGLPVFFGRPTPAACNHRIYLYVVNAATYFSRARKQCRTLIVVVQQWKNFILIVLVSIDLRIILDLQWHDKIIYGLQARKRAHYYYILYACRSSYHRYRCHHIIGKLKILTFTRPSTQSQSMYGTYQFFPV